MTLRTATSANTLRGTFGGGDILELQVQDGLKAIGGKYNPSASQIRRGSLSPAPVQAFGAPERRGRVAT